MSRCRRWWPPAALVALASGCASPLPTYPPLEPGEAIAAMRARDERLRTLTGECAIILRSPEGSARLDGAFALEAPDRFRVRAWKFSSAVLDLCVTPEGTRVWTSDRVPPGASEDLSRMSNDGFASLWRVLAGRGVEAEGEQGEQGQRTLRARSGSLIVEVDRATLTIRRVVVPGERASGEAEDGGEVHLDRYVSLGGDLVWPGRLVARHGTSTIELRFRALEPNVVLDPRAFQPSPAGGSPDRP